MAQDLITKNPCDFCKPPKRVKTPINALPREERTHMLELARRAAGAFGHSHRAHPHHGHETRRGLRAQVVRPLRRRHHHGEPRPGKRRRRLLREGAQDPKLAKDNPLHQAHLQHAAPGAGRRHAHRQRVRSSLRRPLHTGHAEGEEQALQPHAVRQGLRALL